MISLGKHTYAPPIAVANAVDYVRGTWVTALSPVTSGTITLSTNVCSYIKSGQLVAASGFITVGSVSAPVGVVFMTGPPFPAAAGAKSRPAVSFEINNVASSIVGITGQMTEGTNVVSIFNSGNGTLSAIAQAFKAGTQLIFSVTYVTDA